MRQTDKDALEEGVCRAPRRDAPDWAMHAVEDNWPARPTTFMVPFAPGGITDNTARVLAKILGSKLGHPVVVDKTVRAPADPWALKQHRPGRRLATP